MVIIHENRFQYDTAMAFGQDLTYTYVRDTQEYDTVPEELKFITGHTPSGQKQGSGYSRYENPNLLPRLNNESSFFTFAAFKIVFCGKIYPGVRIMQRQPVKGVDQEYAVITPFVTKVNHFYTLDSVDDYMRSMKQDKFFITAKDLPWWRNETPRYGIEKFFNNDIVNNIDVLVEQKVPVLAWDLQPAYMENFTSVRNAPHVLTKNVRLRDYEFYKVFDSCTAYQELDMFISGMIAPENKPVVVVEDKYKVVQHGFDCHSFKKDATKRKPKLCKKPS